MTNKRNTILFILSFLATCSMIFLLVLDKVNYFDDFSLIIENFFAKNIYFRFFYAITSIMTVTGIFLLVILLIYILRKKKRLYALKNFICTLLFGTLSLNLLKIIIHRTRPLEKLIAVEGYSFPSGHAYTSTIVYGFFILIIHRYYQKGKYKYLLYALFGLMIFLTCLSRIYFRVHYVSDVLTGFFLGIVTLSISNYFLKKSNQKYETKNKN